MQRMTKQRQAVLDELTRVTDFRSAQQIFEDLHSQGHRVGLATVTSKPYHLRENYLLENYLKGVRPTTLSVSHTLLTTPTDRLVGDSDTTLHKEFRQSRRPEREATPASYP